MHSPVRLIPVFFALLLTLVACSQPEQLPYPAPATSLNLVWETDYPPEIGIGVRWALSATAEVDGYIVDRAVEPDWEYQELARLGPAREGFIDTAVEPGATYRYRVWTVKGDYMVLDRNPVAQSREFTAP